MNPDFLSTLYKNQLKMMSMRMCEITSKHRDRLKYVEDICNNVRSINKLDGTYTRGEITFRIFYIKSDSKQSNKSNSTLIKEMITNTSKDKKVEYILITDIEEKNIKIMKNIEYKKRITLFTFNDMYIFAPDHFLVPKHTPVYNPDALQITDKQIEEMQTVPYTDIVIKILGLKPGQVVIVDLFNPIACINEKYNVMKLVV